MALFASLNYFLKWVFLQCGRPEDGTTINLWIHRNKPDCPEDMRPVIHGSRGPEDRRKKTGRPEDMRPLIHGLIGPED